MSIVSDQKRQMVVQAVRRKVGDPTPEIEAGAVTSSSRPRFETNPLVIAHFDTVAGDDGTGDGTAGNPWKTYAKAVAEIGSSSLTHAQLQNTATIFDDITVPTQAAVGIIGNIGADFDTWSKATDPGYGADFIEAVAADSAGNWVSGGANGKIFLSTDTGQTWTAATTPSFGADQIFSIATDKAGNWVAVGGSGKIAFSTDNGDTWTQATTPSFGGTVVRGVATDRAGRWVAVGLSGKIAFSTDNGDTWTQATTPSFGTTGILSVDTDRAGRWIAVGGSGKMAVSTDGGINWTQISHGLGSNDWGGIATDTNENWIAVGSGIEGISSDDGVTWAAPTTPLGGTLRDIATDELGRWVAVGDAKLGHSSDNGDTWTSVANIGVGEPQGLDVAYGEADGWVSVDGPNLVYYIEAPTISNSVCGYTIDPPKITAGNLTFQSCTISTTGKRAIELALRINLDRCFLKSAGDTLDLTTNFLSLRNSVVKTTNAGKRAFKLTGAAATSGDIDVEFNAIIATTTAETAVEIDNDAGGGGLEIFQNNIIEGGMTATEQTTPFTMPSGNLRGSVDTGILVGSKVSSSDPLFVDPDNDDYRLRRESGYSDTEDFPFDSPLIQAAVDHATATVDHALASGQVRDFGAYGFDDSLVTLGFTVAKVMDRPRSVKFEFVNSSQIYAALSGELDVYNDPDRRIERLTLTWEKGLPLEDVRFFDLIERQIDTRVFLQLDPTQRIEQPDVTIDGAHPAGSVVIDIAAAAVFSGSILELGEDYFVLYGLDANNKKNVKNVVKLVLDRPLTESLSDLQVVNLEYPFGTGEYIYDAGKNPGFSRQDDSDEENLRGFSATFLRKVE